jgi:hypothetical protein
MNSALVTLSDIAALTGIPYPSLAKMIERQSKQEATITIQGRPIHLWRDKRKWRALRSELDFLVKG